MRRDFYWIGVLLLALWLIRIVDATIPYDLDQYGLYPRRWYGLEGLVTLPLLHGSFGHLFSNSVSLFVLLALLVATERAAWPLVGLTHLFGASLLWLVGRNANHIGASGLVFGLIGLLVVRGFLKRELVAIAVAVLVGILFGGTLLSGIVPLRTDNVSWDGHLCGFLGGVAAATVADRGFRLRKQAA